MADDSRWTDPLVAAIVRNAGDWFPSSLPIKTLSDTYKGVKEPITEKDLSPEQQAFLLELLKRKKESSGQVTYKDYMNYAQEQSAKGSPVGSFNPGLFSLMDPHGQLQTTLGQFRYSRLPNNQYSLQDMYDFNSSELSKLNGEVIAGSGPYAMIREWAGRNIPPGKGRPVNITLQDLMKK